MKKYIYPSLALSILLAVPLVVHAQQGQGQGQGIQQQVQDPETHVEDEVYGMPEATGSQVQNQDQVNAQNQGEDSQLKVKTQTNEESQFSTEKGSVNRSIVARSHMSTVAQAVEQFLSTGNKTGGIGQQVSAVAKAQQQAQTEIKDALDRMDKRSGVVKSLLGYDAKAVKEMNQLIEQNQLRIQQLQQLIAQTQNQGELTQLQLLIQSMEDQNIALMDQVNLEEQSKGVFGWLSRLFN